MQKPKYFLNIISTAHSHKMETSQMETIPHGHPI